MAVNDLACALPLLAMERMLFRDPLSHEQALGTGHSSEHARVTSVFQAICSLCWTGDHIPHLKVTLGVLSITGRPVVGSLR